VQYRDIAILFFISSEYGVFLRVRQVDSRFGYWCCSKRVIGMRFCALWGAKRWTVVSISTLISVASHAWQRLTSTHGFIKNGDVADLECFFTSLRTPDVLVSNGSRGEIDNL
jgi:hypothetical protein